MKLICVGKIKENYLKDAINEYLKRLSKYTKLEVIELKDSNINDEEELILKQLSKKLEEWFINSYNIVFVVGGSCGLSENVKKRSNYKISFSKLTFPHQLFRVILLVQIYRSFKIINN